MNSLGYDIAYLNYTQVEQLYGDQYNLSPRFQQTYYYQSGWEAYAPDDVKVISNVWNQISIMDLEREANIELGTSWPYPDLAADECVLSSDYEK